MGFRLFDKIPSNEQGKDRKERDYRRNGIELRQDYKVILEMNDILLPWKRITRALPKARRYAYDRAPTIEEIFLFSNCFPTEPRTTPTPKATASDVTASGISDLTS